jgi:hypothetical protein
MIASNFMFSPYLIKVRFLFDEWSFSTEIGKLKGLPIKFQRDIEKITVLIECLEVTARTVPLFPDRHELCITHYVLRPYASPMQMLAKINRVQLAARHDAAAFAFDQAGAAQAEEDEVVRTGVFADHLLHALDQILFAMKAEQVIAQMIAERATLISGLAEQIGGS